MQRCMNCVLPVTFPGLAFDGKGLCTERGRGGRPCQFSPDMGPSVFGHSGPLHSMTVVRLQVENEVTIDVRQSQCLESIGTSFRGSFEPCARKLVPVMTMMWAACVRRSRYA